MDIERIAALDFGSVNQSYTARDTILYALGLGYGADPLDEAELGFVYELGLKTVPTLASLLCHPGFWARNPEYKIDWVKVLHAEQAMTIHAPLPPEGNIRGQIKISCVEDKGADRGALVHQDKILYDNADGTMLATVRSTLMLRGNGGEGGFGTAPAPAQSLPERAPDRIVEIPTTPGQALIYRLSGDWNPLHADPAVAKAAGFDRPILHGLCSQGIACRAILAAYCNNQPNRIESMFVRFSRPVYPGETLKVEFFEEAELIRFRMLAKERNIVVLDRCTATLTS